MHCNVTKEIRDVVWTTVKADSVLLGHYCVLLFNLCMHILYSEYIVVSLVTSVSLGCVLHGSFTHSTPQEFIVSGPNCPNDRRGFTCAEPSFVMSGWRWWLPERCSLLVLLLLLLLLLLLNISNLMGNEAPDYWHALVLKMRNIVYVSALAHTFHKKSNKRRQMYDLHSGCYWSYSKVMKIIYGCVRKYQEKALNFVLLAILVPAHIETCSVVDNAHW